MALKGDGGRATLDTIGELVTTADGIRGSMRELAEDRVAEQGQRRYRLTEAAQLAGRSVDAVRRAEAAGDLPAPALRPSGQRLGYTLADVNAMREHFGTRPHRAPDDAPVILAVQNFKGGVGKSTIAAHAAQYFAERGYRVLIVDTDSQASTTA